METPNFTWAWSSHRTLRNPTVLACDSFIPFAHKRDLHPLSPSMKISWYIFRYACLVQFNIVLLKNYLSAIRHYHSSHGYRLSLSAFLRLQVILRAIKRSQGDNSKTDNIAYIEFILPPLKCEIFRQQRLLNGLGSYGTCLFRFSSYWGTNRRFSLQSWKSPFSFSDQLKVSQTDPFRKGQTKVTGKANSHLCRLSATLAYLESCTLFPTTGP